MENRHLNVPILVASLTMAATFGVHLFVGGPELYTPLRESSLSIIEQATFSVIWHFTSAQLFLLSGALLYLARHQNRAVFTYVFVTLVGFALLFLGYGIADLNGVLAMPQWIAFLLALGGMIWGLRKS